jgi:hypothetical protein
MACKKKKRKIDLSTNTKIVRRLKAAAKRDQRAVLAALRPLLNNGHNGMRRRAGWASAAVERQIAQIDAGGGMAMDKILAVIRRHLTVMHKVAKGDKCAEAQLRKVERALGRTAYLGAVLCTGKVGRLSLKSINVLMPGVLAVQLMDMEMFRGLLVKHLRRLDESIGRLRCGLGDVDAFLGALSRPR